MKMKSINKILASVLSVSMLMGGTLPVLAAEGEVDAPIYSFDVVDVIVPTTYAVAFNPQGLTVKTGESSSSQAQILSKNYGLINKSTSDKLITVKLTVEDQNTDSGITFVDSAQDVTEAADGEFKIHLTAIPAGETAADDNDVKVGGADATQATTAETLSDVSMTGATGNATTMKSGDNYIGFVLKQANWDLKDGKNVTLGETTSNNVQENYEVKSLADKGEGFTAFTFGGEMNKNANWSELTKGIKIKVVYDSQTAASDLTAVSGTDAMVVPNIAPTFSTGKGIGQINYSAGTGDDGLKEIKKVEILLSGTAYDGYNAMGTSWPAATDESGVITLDSKFLSFWKSGNLLEATVTYETNGGATETAKVNVKRVVIDEAPTFTTGSGIGQINYTKGDGNIGLKKIQKIEMTLSGTAYDGYNAMGTSWSAATDVSGVITFDSNFMAFWKTGATIEATVTYETNSGEVYTATVNVKRQ